MLKSQKQLYDKAVDYFDEQDFESSTLLFEALCNLDDEDYKNFFYAGISSYFIANFEDAIVFFDKSLKLEPNHFDALLFKSWSYFLLDKYDEALQTSSEAYALESNNEILFLESSILLELEEFENANEFLELYLNNSNSNDKFYTDALFKKAICLFSLGGDNRLLEALDLIDKALLINHDDVEFLNLKGLLLNLSDKEKAKELYSKSIELDGTWEVPYLNLGKLYFDEGLFNEALDLFEKALNLKYDFADAWYYKALTYQSLKDHINAKVAIEKALKLNKDNFDYILTMAQILDELDLDEANNYFDKFLTIEDEFGEGYIDKYYIFQEEDSKLKEPAKSETKEESPQNLTQKEDIPEPQKDTIKPQEDNLKAKEENTTQKDFSDDEYIIVVHDDEEEDTSDVSYGRWATSSENEPKVNLDGIFIDKELEYSEYKELSDNELKPVKTPKVSSSFKVTSRFYDDDFDNNEELKRIEDEQLKSKLNPFRSHSKNNKNKKKRRLN